ncbi:BON domain-containing protein [Pedobacter fastidiosus]|uniref:BON domain-containing protein n=1 Tax=Pedobacter fastidiosus TaxID=2765361 RepID=A0ABR7KSH4_9SPHI|nr:BON domain-containing protein [Pedobacter fastidiosus]MBC6110971.1 BON domain-containing protein [Pedobacter fastidiosus]
MKSNESLQKDVQEAIKWEPLLNAAEIGVTVKDGVVTLTGTVDSYVKKTEAEDAAKKVSGVAAVVENIEVKFGDWGAKEDGDIAREVLNALKWSWQVPNDKVEVKVEKGWVTLEGELSWNYQKDAAKTAIKNLLGVKGVINSIKIASEVKDAVEKGDIERAIARNWSINDQDIHVNVSGNRVTLSGEVSSLFQKDEAQRIAWNAPGVWYVDNEISVQYDYLMTD